MFFFYFSDGRLIYFIFIGLYITNIRRPMCPGVVGQDLQFTLPWSITAGGPLGRTCNYYYCTGCVVRRRRRPSGAQPVGFFDAAPCSLQNYTLLLPYSFARNDTPGSRAAIEVFTLAPVQPSSTVGDSYFLLFYSPFLHTHTHTILIYY